MPSITLDVQSAKLTSKFGSIYGQLHEGKWLLVHKVKLPWRERLELGTGEKAGDVEMHLTFRETALEYVEWASDRTKEVKDFFKSEDERVFGVMTYHAEWSDSDSLHGGPASILFEIYAPAEVVASLMRFAENGRFIKQATVEVRGLEYDHAPDGSEKKWLTNKDQPILPIVNVDYVLPLVAEADEEAEPGEPATSVGADLAPILKETLKWIKGVVYLLVALAVAVALKR